MFGKQGRQAHHTYLTQRSYGMVGAHRLATGVYLLDERTPHLASSLYIVSVLSVIPLQIKIMHPERSFIILRLTALDWKIKAKAVGYGLSPLFRVCVCVRV